MAWSILEGPLLLIVLGGEQELFVFAITRRGRVETTNYRTVKLPANLDIPTYVKGDFASFYKSMFNEQAKRHTVPRVAAARLPLRQRQDDVAIGRKVFCLRQIAPVIRNKTIAFEYRHFQMSKPA